MADTFNENLNTILAKYGATAGFVGQSNGVKAVPMSKGAGAKSDPDNKHVSTVTRLQHTVRRTDTKTSVTDEPNSDSEELVASLQHTIDMLQAEKEGKDRALQLVREQLKATVTTNEELVATIRELKDENTKLARVVASHDLLGTILRQIQIIPQNVVDLLRMQNIPVTHMDSANGQARTLASPAGLVGSDGLAQAMAQMHASLMSGSAAPASAAAEPPTAGPNTATAEGSLGSKTKSKSKSKAKSAAGDDD